MVIQANDLSQREAWAKENEELVRCMSGVEEMVANLIVDQQAMAKLFQEHGDRHSGSLGCHQTELEVARSEIDRLQANQTTIVTECSMLRTQVKSMGDNLCRSGLRKEFLGYSILMPFYVWGVYPSA